MATGDLHCPHCDERDLRALLVLELKDIPRFKDRAPMVICRTCAVVISISLKWALEDDPKTLPHILEALGSKT